MQAFSVMWGCGDVYIVYIYKSVLYASWSRPPRGYLTFGNQDHKAKAYATNVDKEP